jgi:hypothetical protein
MWSLPPAFRLPPDPGVRWAGSRGTAGSGPAGRQLHDKVSSRETRRWRTDPMGSGDRGRCCAAGIIDASRGLVAGRYAIGRWCHAAFCSSDPAEPAGTAGRRQGHRRSSGLTRHSRQEPARRPNPMAAACGAGVAHRATASGYACRSMIQPPRSPPPPLARGTSVVSGRAVPPTCGYPPSRRRGAPQKSENRPDRLGHGPLRSVTLSLPVTPRRRENDGRAARRRRSFS